MSCGVRVSHTRRVSEWQVLSDGCWGLRGLRSGTVRRDIGTGHSWMQRQLQRGLRVSRRHVKLHPYRLHLPARLLLPRWVLYVLPVRRWPVWCDCRLDNCKLYRSVPRRHLRRHRRTDHSSLLWQLFSGYARSLSLSLSFWYSWYSYVHEEGQQGRCSCYALLWLLA